jgi:hypothetical protein
MMDVTNVMHVALLLVVLVLVDATTNAVAVKRKAGSAVHVTASGKGCENSCGCDDKCGGKKFRNKFLGDWFN